MRERDTKPGDLIGRDSSGQIRIDRVLPLPWLLGLVFLGAAQAFALFYGFLQLRETVAELKVEMHAMRKDMSLQNSLTAVHTYQITSLEQRISALEARRQP